MHIDDNYSALLIFVLFSLYRKMFSHHLIGLFLLLIAMATVMAATNQSSFEVICDFGEPYYSKDTTVLVNGSLMSRTNARSCHVKHEVESAIVRVTVTGLNSSSNLSALYSVVLENVNVLFVAVAHSHDLVGGNKYHFHACPSHVHTANNLDLLFFGAPENESFAVTVELDNTVLRPGEVADFSVRSDGLAEVKAFDIKDEQLSSLLEMTVSSEDDTVECLLEVSQSCSSAQSQGLTERSSDVNQSSIKLTFTKSGRITLSQYSSPMIMTGRWYIGIHCKSIDKESSYTKKVSLHVTQGYTYDMSGKALPTAYMCIVTILGGIVIAVFAHFFLNSDFDDCSGLLHLEAEGQTRVHREPSQGILEYAPDPIPRMTFPIKQWIKVIFVAWFGRGIKTYSYLTGVLAISFMVGSAQFVIARWSNMIKEGNRDLCYYNELCYRPIAIADMPSNFMLSNVPYVIHGIFLALSFSFREAIAQHVCQSNHKYSLQNARCRRVIPYDYSVAYALSWALVFEGLFSATYHLCPSRLTFQFDSAFMFIISGLVVVALYNCRVKNIYLSETERENSTKHPSETTIQAPKYFLFFVAPLLVFNYVGSIKDTKTSIPRFFEVSYWIALALWLIVMYIWTFQKVGLPCKWKRCTCSTDEDCWKTEALVKWVWIILFPLCLLIIGFTQKADWSQFFLFSCVAAVVLSIMGLMSFDTALSFKRHRKSGGDCLGAMKQLCHPKRIFETLLHNWHRVLFMIVTFIFWVFAMYFFKIKSTTRKVAAPSFSRTKNEECVLWDFFDYHDIWHMLSSFALFMSAYLLIYVTRKVEIHFWVETMYWKDRDPANANGHASNAEEVVQPTDVDILLKGKKGNSGIIIMEERLSDNDIVVVSDASNSQCANVSYV